MKLFQADVRIAGTVDMYPIAIEAEDKAQAQIRVKQLPRFFENGVLGSEISTEDNSELTFPDLFFREMGIN